MSAALLLCGLTLAAAPAAMAQEFPLAAGNVWVYKAGGTRPQEPVIVQVTGTGTFGGNLFYRVEGWPREERWLRPTSSGDLVEWRDGREMLWWRFAAPEGDQWETAAPTCCGRAQMVARDRKFDSSIGPLGGLREIGYPGVFQVGVVRELFLPGSGLIHRMENTGGPSFAVWDLVYARVNGIEVLEAPGGLSAALFTDRAEYVQGETMLARLHIRRLGEPWPLLFPSGQTFDFVLRDEAGKAVWRWSDGKAFTLATRRETIQGERNYPVLIPLAGLAPGRYDLEAFLTAGGVGAKTSLQVAAAASAK